MPTIHVIEPDGTPLAVPAPAGFSLMQALVGAGVSGIVGECGGSAMCATCHVYVQPPWGERLPPPAAPELELLDCTAAPRLPNSRLSCQLRLDDALDGLTVRLPERQQ